MAKFTKSKADLTKQIGRLSTVHKNHRLYSKALDLVTLYRQNMTMSKQNKDFENEYNSCLNSIGLLPPWMEEKAVDIRIRIYTFQYPVSLYAQKTGIRTIRILK